MQRQLPITDQLQISDEAQTLNSQALNNLEGKIGILLPGDYRTFLLTHSHKVLPSCLKFKPPYEGTIDNLLTLNDIVENDEKGQIGIPDLGLLHIGDSLVGAYLYLALRDQDFGEIAYYYRYYEQFRFSSFTAFLENTTPSTN